MVTLEDRNGCALHGALALLEAHRWPGNVRELQNVLQYAALRAGDADIDVDHLPPDHLSGALGFVFAQRLAHANDRDQSYRLGRQRLFVYGFIGLAEISPPF